MNCDDIQQRISDSLDEGQPLDDDLRRHSAACAAFARDCRRLDSILKAGGRAAPPVTYRRRRLGLVAGLCGLAAAAIVFVALPTVPWGRMSTPSGSGASVPPLPMIDADVAEVANRAVTAAGTAAMNSYRQELDSLVDDARSTAASLLTYVPSAAIDGDAGDPAAEESFN